ncbi:MAG: hypothetical protein ACLFWL_14860 [Candidatus Brocadiia bacterium]
MAASSSNDKQNFTTFAWQGITLTVPEEWSVIVTRGDYDSGYVALADESQMRLQLKWDEAEKNADPSGAATRYIRELRKNAKKEKNEITVNRQLNLANIRGKKIECYEWVSANRGIGMVSICQKCRRVVHVAVLGDRDESMRNLSRTVFASLSDHPENGEMLWKFYDVEFYSPGGWRLHYPELKTGCIRMPFRKKREELEFIRVSLAQILLSESSLSEWFRDFFESELKRKSCTTRETQVKRHEAIEAEIRPWLLFDPLRLIGKGKRTRVKCWHCPESNRIMLVHYSGRGGPEVDKLLDFTVETMKCCENA